MPPRSTKVTETLDVHVTNQSGAGAPRALPPAAAHCLGKPRHPDSPVKFLQARLSKSIKIQKTSRRLELRCHKEASVAEEKNSN